MYTTRGELLQVFLRFMTELEDDEARNIAEDLLNRAVQRVWSHKRWLTFESAEPYQLLTEVGVSKYALPTHFGTLGVGEVRNLTTGTRIRQVRQRVREQVLPSYGTLIYTSTGEPQQFELSGKQPVFRQPEDSGWELELVSDDTDDTDVVVSLNGEDPEGIRHRISYTLTGTTPVSADEWRYLDGFGKSFTPAVVPGTTAGTTEHTTSRGIVSLRRITPNQTTFLQRLDAIEASRSHQILRLFPTPAAAYVIGVPIYLQPQRLVFDGDPLPEHLEEAIEEEMQIQWRVNTGELPLDQATNAIRPALKAAVEWDNANRQRLQKRPFVGAAL